MSEDQSVVTGVPEPGSPELGSEVSALPSGSVAVPATRRPQASSLRQAFTGYTLVGAMLVAVVVILSLGAPIFAIHDPHVQDVARRLSPPAFMHGGSWVHPLGTDGLGRDLWARMLYGLRTSLLVSVPAVAIAAGLGILIGVTSGYFGGLVNGILMRLTDIQMAFPFIILAITVLSVFSPGPTILIVVLSLSAWPVYARIIRSIAMVDAHSEYVLAARAMGASHFRIITRYLLRNLIVSVLILSTLDIAAMVILEALLSFLGLGIQAPNMSLGTIMADGKDYLANGVWWIATLPGVMILITLLGLNLMGDGLQNRLDTNLK